LTKSNYTRANDDGRFSFAQIAKQAPATSHTTTGDRQMATKKVSEIGHLSERTVAVGLVDGDKLLGTANDPLVVAVQPPSPSSFRTAKNVGGHNGAGPCNANGLKVGDVVLSVTFAKPTAAASTQAGLIEFEGVISVANQIQQTGVANLSAEAFDVLVLAQS
jgi:hypothetical protein